MLAYSNAAPIAGSIDWPHNPSYARAQPLTFARAHVHSVAHAVAASQPSPNPGTEPRALAPASKQYRNCLSSLPVSKTSVEFSKRGWLETRPLLRPCCACVCETGQGRSSALTRAQRHCSRPQRQAAPRRLIGPRQRRHRAPRGAPRTSRSTRGRRGGGRRERSCSGSARASRSWWPGLGHQRWARRLEVKMGSRAHTHVRQGAGRNIHGSGPHRRQREGTGPPERGRRTPPARPTEGPPTDICTHAHGTQTEPSTQESLTPPPKFVKHALPRSTCVRTDPPPVPRTHTHTAPA